MKTMNVRFPESFPLIELIKFANSHGLDVRLRQDGDLILKGPEVKAKTEGNAEMDGKAALKFWAEWKSIIRAIIEKSPAAPTTNKTEEEKEPA